MAMRYKAALIDLSGTLHIGDKVIAGGVEALTKLRNHGLKVSISRAPPGVASFDYIDV
jgi:ribonucleotide monophosphatase NagD (HAD superfamily)